MRQLFCLSGINQYKHGTQSQRSGKGQLGMVLVAQPPAAAGPCGFYSADVRCTNSPAAGAWDKESPCYSKFSVSSEAVTYKSHLR